MDFFEAQARARKRSFRIVAAFLIIAAGLVAGGYAAIVFALKWALQHPQIQSLHPPRLDAFLPWLDFATIVILVLVGRLCFNRWRELREGGAAVADWVGAVPVPPDTTDPYARRLLNVVEEMALASSLPIPPVYLLRDEACINAFAAGFTPNDAVIVVTRGALRRLKRDELQGVIAHEFSHIMNGDMRLNIRLASLLHGFMFVTVSGLDLYHAGCHRLAGATTEDRLRRRLDDSLSKIAKGVTLMLAGLPGYFMGRVVQAAVSRQREVLADAAAVQFTRNFHGLVGALYKIERLALKSHLQVEKSILLGHTFFAQGFRWQLGGLWATHPPLRTRIRTLTPTWDNELVARLDSSDDELEPAPVDDLTELVFNALPKIPVAAPARVVAFKPTVVVDDIGALTDVHLRQTQALLQGISPQLRAAARDTARAPALVVGLALGERRAERDQQLQLVATHAGAALAAELTALRTQLSLLDPAARLPLLQLCTPALRTLEPAVLEAFIAGLHAAVHADATITPYEFALLKMVEHQLGGPRVSAATTHGIAALAASVVVVLSAGARLSNQNAAKAFAAGREMIPELPAGTALLQANLCSVEQLDPALDQLAAGTPAVKKALLVALAHVIGHDRTVTVEEGEFFRALAAALDCPVPPLAGS